MPHRWVLITLLTISATSPGVAAESIDFSHQIVPILRKHCVECHGGHEAKGGFSINTRRSFTDDGYATPGDVDASYFFELVTSADPELQMPPKGKPRVTADEVKLLKLWIEQELPWESEFSFSPQRYEPPLLPREVVLPPAVNGRNHPIDRILDNWLQERNLPLPSPIDDATFYRRVSLDLTGLLPSPAELKAFVQDPSPDKREVLVDQLLQRDIDYADHWLSFWNDLLRNDYTGTGFITGGRSQISSWLYESLLWNKPYDQFVRELLNPPSPESRGFIDGIKWRGEVSAGQTVEIQFSQSLSQAFLGVNMKCASCHDSFIDRWTLKEAYGLAAIYSTRELPIHRCDKPTGEIAAASWLFPELGQIDANSSQPERLRQLSELMTDPRNGRFSRTIVNRLWAQLMGRGIVHPLDAMQSPPWNADLLDELANTLVENNYDLKSILRFIATSEAYQSETEVLQDATEQNYVYRGPRAKRLTAEQFIDAVWSLTGSSPDKIDAPVLRAKVRPEELQQIQRHGQWIWSPLTIVDGKVQQPAGGETILLRKVIELPAGIAHGTVAVTCDNEFSLFINNREVAKGNNWEQLQTVKDLSQLHAGRNEIVAIAKNGASTPNPAGFYFEARMTDTQGNPHSVHSDDSWEWNPNIPKVQSKKLGAIQSDWKPTAIIPELSAWKQSVDIPAKVILASGEFTPPMTRASLMKSDFLMRSLGRPLREQIVSSRPGELTTLEAIDLTNGETLSASLAQGGKKLSEREWDDNNALIEFLFLSTLCRVPTEQERTLILEGLSTPPRPEQVEDLLWAILMMPEFMLNR